MFAVDSICGRLIRAGGCDWTRPTPYGSAVSQPCLRAALASAAHSAPARSLMVCIGQSRRSLEFDSCRRGFVLGSCPKVSNASVARCVPRWVFAEFTLGHPGHCDEGRAQNLIAMCMAALTPSPFAFILHVFVARHTRSAFSLDTASISAHAPQAEALSRRRSHR